MSFAEEADVAYDLSIQISNVWPVDLAEVPGRISEVELDTAVR